MSQQQKKFAIVGMGCRFPGHANSLPEFWENLANKKDCIVQVPDDRWNAEYFNSTDKDRPSKTLTSRCGFVDHVYDFDYEAFGISKREAEKMDPQQKMLLEVSLQALEDAGIKYQGSKTGVFVGIGQEEHFSLSTHDRDTINAYSVTGTALSIASNRISYVFNLHGPSMSIDTACSSAVTAFDMALKAIDNGECEQAVVGGVNLLMDPAVMIQFSKLGVLSHDARCKSFDKSANGYVRSEGCGAVILKPLELAQRDGNHIYAVVLGAATNSDGRRSPSLTMPSGEAQVEVFRKASQFAQINPKQVFFAEAHATGTKVGDPIEANAIGTVFGGAERSAEAPKLRLGAVKTNVGHLECASFMAGLIKSALMLDKGVLLPTIHFSEPNPDIKFDEHQMQVQTELESFDADGKLVAISSFGFGGSNGCAILQGYRGESAMPSRTPSPAVVSEVDPVRATSSDFLLPPPYLYMLSAETAKGVEARIEAAKSADMKLPIRDLSATLMKRQIHRYAAFGVGESPASTIFTDAKQSSKRQPIIWVFAGQGPQHHEMGRQLYQKFPVFRQSIDTSDAIFSAASGYSLLNDIGLFGSYKGTDTNAVYQLKHTLPSLIFLQLALIDLWRSFGVVPDCVVGHSFGEMAAAYASGACRREQIVEAAFHRAKLLERLDGKGTMMALGCGEGPIAEWLKPAPGEEPKVWIAAYNSPDAVSVGGTHEAVHALAAKCKEANLFHRVLKINSAYHTPIMAPLRDEALALFAHLMNDTTAPTIPFWSTVYSKFQEGQFQTDYMWYNIEMPVRFEEAVVGITERFGKDCIFMEMSAHPVLSAYIKQSGGKNAIFALHREQPEQNSILNAAANLLLFNYSVDVNAIYGTSPAPKQLSNNSFPYPLQQVLCYKEPKDHQMARLVPTGTWQPLLGRIAPHPTTETWVGRVCVPSQPWVADHVVQEAVVFPGAGYVEMGLEALGSTSVCNVTIGKVMTLTDKEWRDVRVTVVNVGDAETPLKEVSIYSKPDQWDKADWVHHATLQMDPSKPVADATASIEDERDAWYKEVAAATVHRTLNKRDCYERFKSVGLGYGPVFQGIQSLTQTTENAGYAVVDFSHVDNEEMKYTLHPAILDVCFQVLLGAMRSLPTAFVPVGIKKIQWAAKCDTIPRQLTVYARALAAPSRDSKQSSVLGDIVIIDTATGRMVGKVVEMKAAALALTDAGESTAQVNYAAQWQTWQYPTVAVDSLPKQVQIPSLEKVRAFDATFAQYCTTFMAKVLPTLPTSLLANQPIHRLRYLEWCKQVIAAHPPAADGKVDISGAPEELAIELEAITRVGQNFATLLKDGSSAQRILFSDDLMERLYKKSINFAPFVDALADVFGKIVSQNKGGRVIRILEAGSGTGGLTHKLLEQLKLSYAQFGADPALFPVKYMFTDVSQKFLNDARKQFGDYPWIDYKLFNLEKKPEDQGVEPHSIDILLAFDVLHVAADMTVCLENVRRTLVPNGVLMAIEPTNPPVWMDMYFGLFKEWLSFTDVHQRPAKCTMRRTKWAELLPAHNYTVSTIIADALDINADEFTHSLIIAQANPAAVFSTTEPAKVVTPVVIQPASLVELLKSAQENVTAHEDAATASPFWVVTKGAQPIPDANGVPRVARPEAAEAIGFTRVLSSEYPKHDIRIFDFSADATDDQVTQWVNKLASLVAANSLPDRELSIRDDKVWVSRLVPINTNATAVVASQQKSKKVHFKLDIATKGQLQTLFYAELPERPLASQDVVVDVYASAMNFKDLMIALGMINVPLKNGTSSVNLGLEFSGVVAAVGPNVTNFKVGDEVFGVGNHCFATRVYTTTDFVVKKPAHLTHIEAASIPICFATSYAALIAKARISKGETALIHAGAGGIGQTSIQLCKHFGADVITTVSSEEKRQFLQTKYGVTKFSDSRDNAAWGRDVQTLTNGKGVDVVVNSLKGKAIEIGMDSLSLGGRFVEIGKVDILNNSKLGMGVFLRDTSLHSVQLDIVMDEYPQLMRRYLGEIASLAEQKAIQPIVDKVFPAKDIEGAFRFIMSGKHKGKIIVDYSADQLPAMETVKCFVFNPDTLYVISGGLGALGWESWKWMVGEGARRFLLLSRSGKVTAPQQADIDAFAAQGVCILVAKCDVANREEVFAAYKSAEAKGLLNATTGKVGILHMAMVLRDAGVKNMTEQHLNEAVACKVDGARNLVEYFGSEAASRIEFLSLFSSISSAFGNPDQSNYAAGNSFLDAYAIYLKYEKGVAASVINLAAVEDIGVLAEDFKLRQMSKLRGLHGGLTSVGVLEQLRTMITNPTHVQWIHGNFDFRSLGDTFPLLKSKADHLVDYRMKLGAADAGAGGNVASIESVTLIVARLFSVDPKTIDPSAPLTGLGLDSLMAVELASTLKKSFGIQTTQMELLGGMSIEKIVSKAQQ